MVVSAPIELCTRVREFRGGHLTEPGSGKSKMLEKVEIQKMSRIWLEKEKRRTFQQRSMYKSKCTEARNRGRGIVCVHVCVCVATGSHW